MKKILLIVASTAVTALSGPSLAAPVLLVNGSSSTSETSTTNSITTNLSNLHIAAGNTVTVADVLPDDVSGYAEIWDIRFSNSSPLTSSVRAAYTAFLNMGRSLFVMGENAGFMTRNDSVLTFIEELGGGSLDFAVPSSAQSVLGSLTGPNPVTEIGYLAPGGVTSAGTGSFFTSAPSGYGTGLVFGTGTLANALTGSLSVVFDVNFMQLNADANSQALTANLIKYHEEQTGNEPSPVPLPAAAPLLLAGLGVLGFAARRRKSA